jgi:hypothetical protein
VKIFVKYIKKENDIIAEAREKQNIKNLRWFNIGGLHAPLISPLRASYIFIILNCIQLYDI